MSKIKQVMRMLLEVDDRGRRPSNRKIAERTGLYKGTVNDYVKRIEACPLSVRELLELDDPVLERRLCPGSAAYSDGRFEYLASKMDYLHKEMTRPHMTLLQLYEEYREGLANPYSYSQFCYHYNQHSLAAKPPTVVLTEQREGGREIMVDFAGKKLHITDPQTGEKTAVELFVSTLPASDNPFAIAVPTQRVCDFIYACTKSLEFYGGAPKVFISDNLKSAVVRSDRYEPEFNRVCEDFCNHYGMAMMPARALRPKDKALVENQVHLIYQRVYAALRNRVFLSIEELNEAISGLMDKHRQRRMKEYKVTRQERFLAIDKPALQPLPSTPFEIKHYAEYTVRDNSHIRLTEDERYYSVPYRLMGQKVRVVYTPTVLSIYSNGEAVAVHSRLGKERYVTDPRHVPSYYGDYQKQSPDKYVRRAYAVSATLAEVMERLFASNPLAVPETFYKSADGILHLAKTTAPELLEKTCNAALENNCCTYAFIKRVIASKGAGLQSEAEPETPAPRHRNLRGSEYYF